MKIQQLQRHFDRIGARASVNLNDAGSAGSSVSIDIGRDPQGEYFDISADRRSARQLAVLDTQPRLRHLLLMSRDDDDAKHKFLCGHDERHWFVAAVPERAGASTVKTAFEALMPPAVQMELRSRGVKRKKRNRRRNEAFVRQGEWFFVPVSSTDFPKMLIFRNEPLRRGEGKPHMCEELVRTGGEIVYVSNTHPSGLTEPQFRKLVRRNPAMRGLNWMIQRRNPTVFVRGKVRHADHKTIDLNGWHRVVMNTETQAVAMRHVAFID